LRRNGSERNGYIKIVMGSGVIMDAILPVVLYGPDAVGEFEDRRAGLFAFLAAVVVKRDGAGQGLVIVEDGDVGRGSHEYLSAGYTDYCRFKIKKLRREGKLISVFLNLRQSA
jgi:hypothetical protein